MKLFYDGLMQKLGRRTPEPQDGYRSAWAAQIETMRAENEMLRRKNAKRKRQPFVPLVPGIALLLFGAMSGAGGVLGGVFLSTHLPLFADGRRVTELDEIHIIGRVPAQEPMAPLVRDEMEYALCTPGVQRSCLTALPGGCAFGTQVCGPDGRGFSECLPVERPTPEVENGMDDDCDGIADDGCSVR